jgi:DNA-binding CsgD family transcriptional regulator
VLSDREAQVVRLLLGGSRVPLIARQLHLSPSTVRNQLSMVYRKLGVSSQQELILVFHRLWYNGYHPPALLGAEVLRQPRPLCAACRTPGGLTPATTTTTASESFASPTVVATCDTCARAIAHRSWAAPCLTPIMPVDTRHR